MPRGRRRVAQEPALNDYERKRQDCILGNLRKMEELGIHDIASTIKHVSTRQASAKSKNSVNKDSHQEGSDLSEYLPEEEQVVQGDDEDAFLHEEQPVPILIEYPQRGRRKKTCAKKKHTPKMPPGVRASKRVRAGPPTEVPTGVSTRSTKRQLTSQYAINDQEFPSALETNDLNRPPSPMMDWSYSHDAHEDTVHCEEEQEEQIHPSNEAPRRRGPVNPRPPTRGILLDKMTRSMGRRLPITVAEGKRRPHDPVQAAKFASESGIIIRAEVPVRTHWKLYKEDKDCLDNFMGKLAGRLAIDKDDAPTKNVCSDVLKRGIRQTRYNLKRAYFNGIPANEVRTTSPVNTISDEEWQALVAKWSNPKNMQIAEKNKQNRLLVKYHQTTGSRCYPAHLHEYRGKNNVVDLDAVDAFEECHTRKKKGLSDAAKEALLAMQTMMEDPIADGDAPIASEEVVSRVLSKDGSNSTFLKNAGMKMKSKKTPTSTEKALREELAAEKQNSALLREEVDTLKKKAEIADEALAKINQHQEENNLLLRRILSLSQSQVT